MRDLTRQALRCTKGGSLGPLGSSVPNVEHFISCLTIPSFGTGVERRTK